MPLLKYFNHVNGSSETVLPNSDSFLKWEVYRMEGEVPLPMLEQTDHMCKHADLLQCVSYHLLISTHSFSEQILVIFNL